MKFGVLMGRLVLLGCCFFVWKMKLTFVDGWMWAYFGGIVGKWRGYYWIQANFNLAEVRFAGKTSCFFVALLDGVESCE